jgi:hopanoid biosynthesis associated RND transporter like protein HpnN
VIDILPQDLALRDLMNPDQKLSSLVVACARHDRLVVCLAALLAVAAAAFSATHLGMTTSLAGLFDARLPWKQSDSALKAAFPQFNDLIVAVVDARIPEEAEATATGLQSALSGDRVHFLGVRRPDAGAFLQREGLLFLDTTALQDVLDKTVDASPFLGQLAADPSARGLFGALGLVGVGAARGNAGLDGFTPALRGFDAALKSALSGHPAPLSWQTLLAGRLTTLAGQDRIVLIRPKMDFSAVQPGGEATRIARDAIARLPYVASGDATVRLTGLVPLEDTEFSSAAKGALIGLLLSFALVVLWLYLALRGWRLILPVFLTLLLGLALTTGFAALAVGTLNLISVAFAILFVGIAVDFSIQFAVRFREMRLGAPDIGTALALTGARVGRQIAIAGFAIAAGFLAFVPTSFRGVGELGLIAGVGMLIALACTLTFLPAALALFRPAGEASDIGFSRLAPLDRLSSRLRTPILAVFAVLFLAGAALTQKLGFDSNTLHTEPQNTEAMRTLLHLLDNPVTNPFTIDIVRPNEAEAARLAEPVGRLPLVDHVVGLHSFVPADQPTKLAMIQDATGVLAPVLSPGAAPPAPDSAALRQAAAKALDQLRAAVAQMPANAPLSQIAADLAALTRAPDATLQAANTALVKFLPAMLDRLRLVLSARPVTLQDVPPEIARDYIEPNGAARIQVVPKATVVDSDVLRRFVSEVRSVAPDAGGAAVTIVSTADTIIEAFRRAAIGAVIAIAVILLAALRRPLDAALVLAPLLVSAAITVFAVVGLGMSLNFANIIALPLLLGVGVSFNIYYVMNARAGERPRLTSATTRAVIFSALTTGSAFGSLAVSAHPGTASMGTLLLISLGCTLATSLIFMPALLGGMPVAQKVRADAKEKNVLF